MTDVALADAPALAERYRLGMRRLVSGVSLITAGDGATPAGLIATAVTSVSVAPPTLLVCVNQTASAHAAIRDTGAFCVNLLAVDDVEIARQFGNSARRSERFASGDWTALATGAPVLRSALASFDCRLEHAHTHHTHTIFFGTVVAIALGEREVDPLLYFDAAFLAPPLRTGPA